jgi:hypothetical protein
MRYQDRDQIEPTQEEIEETQLRHAENIISNPAKRGSIEHWGAMFLLAQKGRLEKLDLVRPELENALKMAQEKLRIR